MTIDFSDGMLIAGATALATLAYRHPDGYRVLGLIIATMLGALFVYNMGYQNAARDAVRHIEAIGNPPKVLLAIGKDQLRHGEINVYILGIMMYNFVLMALPFFGFVKKD